MADEHGATHSAHHTVGCGCHHRRQLLSGSAYFLCRAAVCSHGVHFDLAALSAPSQATSAEVDNGGVSDGTAAGIAGDCPVSTAGLQPGGQHGGHYRRGKAISGQPDTAARMAQTVTPAR